jgi:hypothetical protein
VSDLHATARRKEMALRIASLRQSQRISKSAFAKIIGVHTQVGSAPTFRSMAARLGLRPDHVRPSARLDRIGSSPTSAMQVTSPSAFATVGVWPQIQGGKAM